MLEKVAVPLLVLEHPFQGLLPLDGAGNDTTHGLQQVDILPCPAFLAPHGIKPQEADGTMLHGEGDNQQRLDVLHLQDLLFRGGFRGHLRNIQDVDDLSALHALHPPRKDIQGKPLQVLLFGRNSRCSPFLGVVHALSVSSKEKDVATIRSGKLPQHFHEIIQDGRKVLRGRMDQPNGKTVDDLLEHQPVKQFLFQFFHRVQPGKVVQLFFRVQPAAILLVHSSPPRKMWWCPILAVFFCTVNVSHTKSAKIPV